MNWIYSVFDNNNNNKMHWIVEMLFLPSINMYWMCPWNKAEPLKERKKKNAWLFLQKNQNKTVIIVFHGVWIVIFYDNKWQIGNTEK